MPTLHAQAIQMQCFALMLRAKASYFLAAPTGAEAFVALVHVLLCRNLCWTSLRPFCLLVCSTARVSTAQSLNYSLHLPRTVRAWDATSGSCLYALEGHSDWISCVKCVGINEWFALCMVISLVLDTICCLSQRIKAHCQQ